MGDLSSISQEGNAPSRSSAQKRDLLLALAERCEREEPSKALDAEIGRAVGITPKLKNIYRRNHFPPPLLRTEEIFSAFTTSLDAAVTLVPEGFIWEIASDNRAYVARFLTAPAMTIERYGEGKTPALRLCVAALKARAAVAEQEQASMKSGEATQDPPLHISDFLGG